MMRLVLAIGAFTLVTALADSATAVYQCGPDKDDCQCGMNNPYPCCDNGGNCTWWAWEQACCHWKVGLPGWGNANQWAGNAKAHPDYTVSSSPVVGAVANRVAGTYGHVAWVTAVNGSQVTVTEQGCWGAWGHSSSTKDASYYDGGFIVRNSQCECSPGQTQTESCGNCGERKRTCNSACQWGGWGECGGQGVCTPGQSEEQSCGDCGKQARTCQNDCSWASFGACEGATPETATACDTGKKGVCAKGVEQCIAGTTECVASAEPSTEICDGLDNDCDGVADDGANCGKPVNADAGAWPKQSSSKSGANAEGDAEDVDGGMGCSVDPRRRSGSPLGVSLLFGLAFWLHRRINSKRASGPSS